MRPRTLALFLVFFLTAGGFVIRYKSVSTFAVGIATMTDDDFRAKYTKPIVQRTGEDTSAPIIGTEWLTGYKPTWKEYLNPRLKFSIRYPDKAAAWDTATCDSRIVEVLPVSDNERNRVFLVPERLQEGSCARPIAPTVAELRIKALVSSAYVPWIIEIAEIANDEEMLAFVRERFGLSCTPKNITPTKQDGTLDLILGTENAGNPCMAEGGFTIKYAPAKKLLATWYSGDKTFFCMKADKTSCKDDEMIGSFKFE